MTSASIFWYDFETFGSDPRRDRASQFAGIRTDENLNIIGEPQLLYCRPAADFLPNPMACLITGITPQKAMSEGLCEAEFIRLIHSEFAREATCVAGYNNIRFDDELTRQLLYRNFYDPYEREWKNGNTRWDILDMARLAAATRPEGITWPKKEDGTHSFQLEALTAANGIEHSDAHDALSDVLATIELARLIKQAQPRLFNYVYRLRTKQAVHRQLALKSPKPLLHVSGMYPAAQGCLAVVAPVCPHPTDSNGVIVYDLRVDPDTWIDLPEDEIRMRLFTPNAQLPEGVSRIPLKTIHTNRCPILTAPTVLSSELAVHYGVSKELIRAHWGKMMKMPHLAQKVINVFRREDLSKSDDPDFMIYVGGFFSDGDKELMRVVRRTNSSELGRLDLPFKDGRLKEMFFRYRARNFPGTLTEEEVERWRVFCRQRIDSAETRVKYAEDLEKAKTLADLSQLESLAQLENYVSKLSEMQSS
ncbi:MAG: exodeoxyribonuclease I [Pseudomonadota bacterium]|nr:exodeoxyribonuclease I [Pseudomonadota bacterium]